MQEAVWKGVPRQKEAYSKQATHQTVGRQCEGPRQGAKASLARALLALGCTHGWLGTHTFHEWSVHFWGHCQLLVLKTSHGFRSGHPIPVFPFLSSPCEYWPPAHSGEPRVTEGPKEENSHTSDTMIWEMKGEEYRKKYSEKLSVTSSQKQN